jgi:AraC-like DNA-binding protein
MLRGETNDTRISRAEPVYSNVNDSSSIAKTTRDSGPLCSKIHLPRHFTLSPLELSRRPAPKRQNAPLEAYDGYARSFLRQPAADCQKLARVFAFFLDEPTLKGASDISSVIGELVWICLDDDRGAERVAAGPALVVYASKEAPPCGRVEIVPNLGIADPLLEHIVLVLRADLQTQTPETRLYAESLTDALAVHFVKRYTPANDIARHASGGLPLYKLRRVICHVNEHLEEDLSLTRLAGVAGTSVAHFVRLFKQATGSTPHQYVLTSRIQRAKRWLLETEVPISEIALRVGLADQSHLTALFRAHAGTTPKAYRGSNK